MREQSNFSGNDERRAGTADAAPQQDELTRYRMRRAQRAAENRGHGMRGSLSSGPIDWAREFRARGEIREPFADWKGR